MTIIAPVHIPKSPTITVGHELLRTNAIVEIYCCLDKHSYNFKVIVLRLQLYRNLFGKTAGVAYTIV